MNRLLACLAALLCLAGPAFADPSAVFPALPPGAVQETAQATTAAVSAEGYTF